MCGLVVTAAATAHGAPSRRYAVLIDDYVDGEKQPASAAESALGEALAAEGLILVDDAQSRKVRSVTDAGTLAAGEVPDVITTLDADVIIAGVCRTSRLASDLLGPSAFRMDATLQARVIAVDTGQILGVFSAHGEAIGFTALRGAEDAARAAIKDLVPRVLTRVRAAATPGGRIELAITGLPDVSATDRVVAAIGGVDGITELRVVHAGRGVTEVELVSNGKSPREIAVAIDGLSGLGVSVVGYSDRAIKAAYQPGAAMAFDLLLTPFTVGGKAGAGAWEGPALARLVGVTLAREPYLALPRGEEVAAARATPAAWSALAKGHGGDPRRTLVLAGSYTQDGERLHVQAKIVVAASGKVLTTESRDCERQGLGACAAGIGSALGERLLQSLVDARAAFREVVPAAVLTAAAKAGRGSAQRPLSVAEARVANVFPARLAAYGDEPLGVVQVTNSGRAPIEGLRVTTQIPGFMASPLDLELGTLAPGESREVPLKVVLDRGALLHHDQNQPAVLVAKFVYRSEGFEIEETRSTGLVVYDRNALSWSEPDSVAAFVNAHGQVVQQLARTLARSASDDARRHQLGLATALFVGLGAMGVRYESDPTNPYGKEELDYVQYPEQTLDRRSGDCDDLAVLFAAVADAVGVRVLLITTPDHVFVAVDSGVPARNRDVVALDAARVLERDGTVWVPLETTLLGKPISEAWAVAAGELARWQAEPDKLGVVSLREAWARFPPVDLVEPGAAIRAPDAEALIKRLGDELTRLDAERERALERLLAKRTGPSPIDLLARGRLLVLAGRAAEAQTLYEQLRAEPEQKVAATTNLGNMHLAVGHADSAYTAYEEAAKGAPDDARIQINAALAAHQRADEAGFAEHIFNALDLGADEAVAELSRLGAGTGGTRGAKAGGTPRMNLGDAVRRALEKRGRPVPKGDGTRASDANADGPVPMAAVVYWL